MTKSSEVGRSADEACPDQVGSPRGVPASQFEAPIARGTPRDLKIAARRYPLVVLGMLLSVCGCGFSQGQLLFFMGDWQGPKIDAEFELTRKGAVLILVDDDQERLSSPRTRVDLAEKLAAELKANKAVGQIVPQAKLDTLRSKHRDFDTLSCREIGEEAGAEQVLVLAVRSFFAQTEIEETSEAARMSVAVKVINVLEKEDRTKVRLWPAERDGRIIAVSLSAVTVIRSKKTKEISNKLTTELADKLAKLFYDHHLADIESW